MRQKGQALIFSLVLLPTLLLASAVLLRSGETAFTHYRVQSHIDRLALDTLAVQAQALEALGKLNPYAQTLIETRRSIEAAQLAGFIFTAWSLEAARQAVIKAQYFVDIQQSAIKAAAAVRSYEVLNRESTQDLRGKVRLVSSPSQIKLHVKEKLGFEGETGAPLALTDDFSSVQNIEIKARAKTQKFIDEKKMQWSKFKNLDDMNIKTFAQIEMEELEGKWKVVLKNKQDN